MLNIYTDGSCKNNNGGWGFIVLRKNKIYEVSGFCKNTTNNRMELIAVIEAIKFCREKRILIHSDSKYVINCAQKIWKRKKNIDLWNLYDNIIINKNIKYKWVKAHNNNFWNEKVDKIANQSRLQLY